MARTVRDARLETRTAQSSAEVIWQTLLPGDRSRLHLGYRKGRTEGEWVIRRYVGDQSYAVATIGVADDAIDADGTAVLSFAQAQAGRRALPADHRDVGYKSGALFTEDYQQLRRGQGPQGPALEPVQEAVMRVANDRIPLATHWRHGESPMKWAA